MLHCAATSNGQPWSDPVNKSRAMTKIFLRDGSMQFFHAKLSKILQLCLQ